MKRIDVVIFIIYTCYMNFGIGASLDRTSNITSNSLNSTTNISKTTTSFNNVRIKNVTESTTTVIPRTETTVIPSTQPPTTTILAKQSTVIPTISKKVNVVTEPTIITPCMAAKEIYRLEGKSYTGFEDDDIYDSEESGLTLKVCTNSKTCCKPPAEINLLQLSEQERAGLTKPLLVGLKKTCVDAATKFRYLFRNMIRRSHKNLDTMFKRTYEDRYQDNSYVFKSLYKSLHQYFNGSELDLQGSVDTFFEKLFEKIYVMSQPWSAFNKKYENCIFGSTNYVKPFGDIQRKVAHQISRSFLASRVFLLGLKDGVEVATKLLQLPVQDECSRAFMRMSQCSICSGVPRRVKPCKNYCMNVLRGCYLHTIIVQPMWNQFIDAMVSLTGKIEGPFSMEAVIEPLGVKISEAIMAFQENQKNITEKVENKCGKPPLSNNIGANTRKRRSKTAKDDDTTEGIQKGAKMIVDKFKSNTEKIINELKAESASTLPFFVNFDVTTEKSKSQFEMMLQETKASLAELKDYWVLLSEKWCTDDTVTNQNISCWNGANTSGYHLPVVKDLVSDLYNNPEVKLLKQHNQLMMDQVSILERNIKLIKSALNGNTEQCVDCEAGSGEGSGEGEDGSGDQGSGVRPTDSTVGSGSGGETTKPTESSCVNSVAENCVETIVPKTTGMDNNIPYVPVKDDVASQEQRGDSKVNLASGLTLLLCVFAASVL